MATEPDATQLIQGADSGEGDQRMVAATTTAADAQPEEATQSRGFWTDSEGFQPPR